MSLLLFHHLGTSRDYLDLALAGVGTVVGLICCYVFKIQQRFAQLNRIHALEKYSQIVREEGRRLDFRMLKPSKPITSIAQRRTGADHAYSSVDYCAFNLRWLTLFKKNSEIGSIANGSSFSLLRRLKNAARQR